MSPLVWLTGGRETGIVCCSGNGVPFVAGLSSIVVVVVAVVDVVVVPFG